MESSFFEGADDVSDMIYHLVQILRENLDFSNELVPMRNELIVIDHYLKVQEIRFGDHFSYEKTLAEGLDSCLIPRMSLQPLFENIFFHAFEDGCGKIRLEVAESNGVICLGIIDNGRGISKDKITALMKAPPGGGEAGWVCITWTKNLNCTLEITMASQFNLRKG